MRKLVAIGMFLMVFSTIYSQNFNVDGIQYVIVSKTNNAEVSYGGDYRGDMVIPPLVTYLGITYKVASIGEGAFSNSWQLTSLVVPGSISIIRSKAFYKCIGLKQIQITEGIDTIGDNAFENCTSLTSFSIPFGPNNTVVGNMAFYNCNKITAISLPNSVTSIGYSAFGYCNSLLSFDIPNGISTIEENTFDWCNSLMSITLPNKVTTIKMNAFGDCRSLKTAFIPNSVTSIGMDAFYNCTALTTISIPASVTSIGMSAFHNCSSLNSVHAEALIPTPISSDCFSGYPASCILYVPDNSEIDYKHATGWGDFNVVIGTTTIFNYLGINYRITAPNEVELFNRNANYLNMMPLDIPATPIYDNNIYKVISIRQSAFSDWMELSKITLPNTINYIGDNAFINCPNLKELKTPEAVTAIGTNAFSGCSNFGHLYIPTSTTGIGNWAFNNCTSIDQIWVNIADPKKLALGLEVFKNVQTDKCNVFVPKGNKALYEVADQWKAFFNILPQPAPSINREKLTANQVVFNILEFDYNAYFLTHSDFDMASAFEFHLASALPNMASDKIRIYPTVVKESVNISGIDVKSTVEVIDTKGNIVFTQTVDNNAIISLSLLPKAVYIIKIATPQRRLAYRIIKN